MNWTEESLNLRFERRRRALPHWLIPVGLTLALFTLLWMLVPHSVLYWMLLPLLGVLAWVATYGWRQSLATLIALLHRLEQF